MKHHAVCYIGIPLTETDISNYLTESHPDVHRMFYDELGIADARELAQRASQTPLEADEHVFIIECERLTHEAQNALLKLFEEPPARSRFYVAVPRRGLLLPTLQSRLHIIEEVTETAGENARYKAFREASYGDRLEQITQICKDNDAVTIEAILRGAEAEACTADASSLLLSAVLTARDHIARRGSSKKMLLESVALALPHS